MELSEKLVADTTEVTFESNSVLEKLLVAQLVPKFPAFLWM